MGSDSIGDTACSLSKQIKYQGISEFSPPNKLPFHFTRKYQQIFTQLQLPQIGFTKAKSASVNDGRSVQASGMKSARRQSPKSLLLSALYFNFCRCRWDINFLPLYSFILENHLRRQFCRSQISTEYYH